MIHHNTSIDELSTIYSIFIVPFHIDKYVCLQKWPVVKNVEWKFGLPTTGQTIILFT